MSTVQLKSTSLEIVAKASSGGFEGYGATFYTLDRAGDVIMPGAFKADIPRFLEDNFLSDVNHNYSEPIGRISHAEEDGFGLRIKADFSDTPRAKTVRTLIRDKAIQKLSVGFYPLETKTVSPAQLMEIWNKSGYSPTDRDMRHIKQAKKVNVIMKAELVEITPTPHPINHEAKILSVKSSEDCPPALKIFAKRFMQSARQLVAIDLKAGKVLSMKNQQKLVGMRDLLNSLLQEVNNLLSLSGTEEEAQEEQTEEESTDGGEEMAMESVLEEVMEEMAEESGEAEEGETESARLKLILEMA
jgi:hypothetical protein